MKAHKIFNVGSGQFKTSSWYGENKNGELFHKPGTIKRWLNSNLDQPLREKSEVLEVIEYELVEKRRIPAEAFHKELNLKAVKIKKHWPIGTQYVYTADENGILVAYALNRLPEWKNKAWDYYPCVIDSISNLGEPGELIRVIADN